MAGMDKQGLSRTDHMKAFFYIGIPEKRRSVEASKACLACTTNISPVNRGFTGIFSYRVLLQGKPLI